ncbi:MULTISPECIES: hypothetical protein [Bacteroidota]|uniref:hypothetical protein n=1 Tax=Bacteroidota TaxID=976 RepID=UPI001F4B28D0|nr:MULTISPECIES: hypothetical protein [Bacteroidota]WON94316.1 hypothetical protein OK025_24115 [Sphingobacterium sp. UGAL515B_05]
MKLKINQVVDFGTLDSERVELSVLEDTNLYYFIISDTTYLDEGKISNKMRHTFWFKPQQVNKGDEVVLYSKVGIKRSTDINGGKNKKYHIYWDLKSSVWNNSGDAAVLFELKTWKTTKVAEN